MKIQDTIQWHRLNILAMNNFKAAEYSDIPRQNMEVKVDGVEREIKEHDAAMTSQQTNMQFKGLRVVLLQLAKVFVKVIKNADLERQKTEQLREDILADLMQAEQVLEADSRNQIEATTTALTKIKAEISDENEISTTRLIEDNEVINDQVAELGRINGEQVAETTNERYSTVNRIDESEIDIRVANAEQNLNANLNSDATLSQQESLNKKQNIEAKKNEDNRNTTEDKINSLKTIK